MSKKYPVGKGYRIPSIEEFVQGFEFERKHTYRGMILDLSNNSSNFIGKPYIIWWPIKVWWMHDPDELITEDLGDGNTMTITGKFANFFKPFDVESFLKQGLIRVKI